MKNYVGQKIVHIGTDGAGHYWYARPDRVGTRKLVSLEEARDLASDFDVVRILGFVNNYELMLSLYDCDFDNYSFRYKLQLGTPAVCNTIASRTNVEIVAQRMSVLSLPASAGGWHYFTDLDAATCRVYVSRALYGPGQEHIGFVQRHPLWTALSYIFEGDAGAVAGGLMLAAIGDPRWYIDPSQPDRRSRLYSYLGLTDKNMYEQNDAKGRHFHNAQLVLTWWGADTISSEKPPRVRSFLLDTYKRFGGGPRGRLRASQKVIDFLRGCWLDEATVTTDGLFTPKYFFTNDQFVEEYLAHQERSTRTV